MKYNNVGKYLSVVRKTHLMTQAEFAYNLSVHPQFVSNWERGLCLPPKHIFNELSKYIDKEIFKKKLIIDYKEHLEDEYGV